MHYIIVWRATHRNSFVHTDSHGFIETYHSYEAADQDASEIEKTENDDEKSLHYLDYKIFESKM